MVITVITSHTSLSPSLALDLFLPSDFTINSGPPCDLLWIKPDEGARLRNALRKNSLFSMTLAGLSCKTKKKTLTINSVPEWELWIFLLQLPIFLHDPSDRQTGVGRDLPWIVFLIEIQLVQNNVQLYMYWNTCISVDCKNLIARSFASAQIQESVTKTWDHRVEVYI